ncbi:MAG: TlyA family RNA methyltransferase [Kiritimatiellaeota bacterium]|nr:TlyA family RNA methyltransferase [Kiritimatiellota bacterium]
MVARKRADVLLFKSGLCESRAFAGKLIMAGRVRVGPDRVIVKPAEMFPTDTVFTLPESDAYVSRGAHKLMPALDRHLPDLAGLAALDIGASTGGFTDLMLRRGARVVYCVDSGRGQLHGKLRSAPRVVCFEKTNARHLPDDFLPERVDVLTMDVSFISATLLLKPTVKFLKDDGYAFILVKPQFEAGRENVGAGGVVRSEEVRRATIDKVVDFAENEIGMRHLDVVTSPIKGPKGNQEFVAVFQMRRTNI